MYYLFPLNSSSSPVKMAASPAAPAPSTTHFSCSTKCRIDIANNSSCTTTYNKITKLKLTVTKDDVTSIFVWIYVRNIRFE